MLFVEEENAFVKSFNLDVVNSLGAPLPADDLHSVSVSLPRWQHVVGYEEGDTKVISAMTAGYPRFRIHDNVTALHNRLRQILHSEIGDKELMVLPSLSTAARFQDFLLGVGEGQDATAASHPSTLFKIKNNLFVALFPPTAKCKAKAFWQHTGEIVSSRLAEEILLELDAPKTAWPRLVTKIDAAEEIENSRQVRGTSHDSLTETVQNRIADLLGRNFSSPSPSGLEDGAERDAVELTVCGMAAIYLALRVALTWEKGRVRSDLTQPPPQVVVFGFPYVDTLKLMSRRELNPGGVQFFGQGDSGDLALLEAYLTLHNSPETDGRDRKGRVVAIFTEFPSNPLLKCPDLARLSALAAAHDLLLVVDDTIAGFSNVDLFRSAGVAVDLQCSSLTKLFNGRGNAMGGSLAVNRSGRHFRGLKDTLTQMRQRDEIPILHLGDLTEIEMNSRSYLRRSHRINQTALQLARWLHVHPLVQRVYYPGVTYGADGQPGKEGGDSAYLQVQRRFPNDLGPGNQHVPGFGCLLSIVLRPDLNTQVFHDSLEVNKGPSLGTDFSLLCPYTLLAHYYELPWAAQFGVSDRLLRLSVGLEDIGTLIQRFEAAFLATTSAT